MEIFRSTRSARLEPQSTLAYRSVRHRSPQENLDRSAVVLALASLGQSPICFPEVHVHTRKLTNCLAGRSGLWLRLREVFGFLAFGCSFVLFALALKSIGQAAMRFGVVGVLGEGFLKSFDGVVDLTLLEESVA